MNSTRSNSSVSHPARSQHPGTPPTQRSNAPANTGHGIPSAVQPPANRRAHDLPIGFQRSLRGRVLTSRPLLQSSLPEADPTDLIREGGRRAEFVQGGAIATGASGLSGIAASAEVVCDGLRVICCQSCGQWGFSCGLAFPVANAAEFRLDARCPGHRACRRLSPAYGLSPLAGWMFWLTWKVLSGS